MGRIFEMKLHIDRSEKSPSAKFEMRRELKGNETGVFALSAGWRRKFDEDAEEDENGNVKEEWQAEVWTGSHDNTARLFDLSAKDQKPPQANSTSTSTKYAAVGSQPPLYSIRSIPHSDYVKTLLPLSQLFSIFSSQSQGTRLTRATAASSLLPDVLLSGSTDEQLESGIWHRDTEKGKDISPAETSVSFSSFSFGFRQQASLKYTHVHGVLIELRVRVLDPKQKLSDLDWSSIVEEDDVKKLKLRRKGHRLGTNSSLLSSGVFGVIKTIGALLWILFMIDRFGRRKIFMVGAEEELLPCSELLPTSPSRSQPREERETLEPLSSYSTSGLLLRFDLEWNSLGLWI
ncbi:hypothetical protein L7F22_048506 [Adiantum nelumboides]|nr:hypothetical protein [Adiantum nelumboides]